MCVSLSACVRLLVFLFDSLVGLVCVCMLGCVFLNVFSFVSRFECARSFVRMCA